MSLHPDRMISNDILTDADEWPWLKRQMILKGESHVLMPIEDIDRLLEGYNPNAQAELVELHRECDDLHITLEEADAELANLEEKVRGLKLLLGNIAADAGSIEAKAHGALASDPA